MLLEIFTEVTADIQSEIPTVKKCAYYKDEFRTDEWKPVFPVVFIRYDGTKPITETKLADGSFAKSKIILSIFAGDKDTTTPKTLNLVEKLENIFNGNTLYVTINSIQHSFPMYLAGNGSDFVSYIKGLSVYRVQVEIEVPTGILPANELELPGAPVLVSPADAASDVDAEHTALSYTCEPEDEIIDFDIFVSNDANFTDIVFQQLQHIYLTVTIPDGIIEPGNTYYWKVRSRNASGKSEFSSVRTFTAIEAAEYEPELSAWLLRITGTQPTNGRKTLMNTFITDLKSSGVFSKLDALWIFAAETSEHARINLIQNKGNITAMNSMTFTADKGYSGNGANMYLRSSTAPKYQNNYSRNDGSFGLFVNNNVNDVAQSVDMGVSWNAYTLIYTRANGNLLTSINDGGSTPSIANANSIGFYAVDRQASGSYKVYKDGALLATQSFASTGIDDFEFFIGARNNVSTADRFANKRYALAFVGKGLSAAEHLNFKNIVLTFLTAIGAHQ